MSARMGVYGHIGLTALNCARPAPTPTPAPVPVPVPNNNDKMT